MGVTNKALSSATSESNMKPYLLGLIKGKNAC